MSGEVIGESHMRLRMKAIWLVAVMGMATVIGSGCGDSSSTPVTPPEPRGEAKVDAVAKPTATVDESLSLAEYIRLGMPAPDRDWSAEDMIKAERILAVLALSGYGQLPRFESERSGEMFSRMTSPRNHELSKNRTLPLEVRLPFALNYLQASNQVMKLYLAAFLKGEVSDREIVEWLGHQLRLSVVVLDVVDEFAPTIRKDDPRYEVRMQGLEQMRRGLASVVSGGLQTLIEKEAYRESELARLVGYMLETYPQIVPRIPPGARTETLLRLEAMHADPALTHLQPGLGELYVKVKASLADTPVP